MPVFSRSGSSIILVAVTEDRQSIFALAKGFNPGMTYRYTFEQFLGEHIWRESVLHAMSANFTISENTRFDRMLIDRKMVPDANNPLAIVPEHILRVVDISDFTDLMALQGSVVENEGMSVPSADTITTNISGTAKRIVSKSELDGISIPT